MGLFRPMQNADTYIQSYPGIGNALVAARAFQPGELVVSEPPLQLSEDKSKRCDQVFAYLKSIGISVVRHGWERADTHAMHCLQYCDADAETKRKIRETMYRPDTSASSEHADSPVIVAAASFARQIVRAAREPGFASSPIAPLATLKEQEIVEVCLAWDMNSHQFLGRAAVFDVGSKLTHTCGLPNTIYRTRGLDNGCGNHVALTAIQPHELLYTSYLGWDDQLMYPRPLRRLLLFRGKLFWCTCTRCASGADDCRGLPCPRCFAAAAASGGGATAASGPGGGDAMPASAEGVRECDTRSGLLALLSPDAPWDAKRAAQAAELMDTWGYVYPEAAAPKEAAAAADAAADASTRGDSDASPSAAAVLASTAAGGSGGAEGGGGERWRCDACGARLAGAEVAAYASARLVAYAGGLEAGVRCEDDLVQFIHRMDTTFEHDDLSIDGDLVPSYRSCLLALGPRHWAANKVRLLTVERLADVLEDRLDEVEAAAEELKDAREEEEQAAAATSSEAEEEKEEEEEEETAPAGRGALTEGSGAGEASASGRLPVVRSKAGTAEEQAVAAAEAALVAAWSKAGDSCWQLCTLMRQLWGWLECHTSVPPHIPCMFDFRSALAALRRAAKAAESEAANRRGPEAVSAAAAALLEHGGGAASGTAGGAAGGLQGHILWAARQLLQGMQAQPHWHWDKTIPGELTVIIEECAPCAIES